MKICVFGAGAIGGHLAVRLASDRKNQVTVITLEPQLSAIQKNGLRLWIGDECHHAQLKATDHIQDIEPQDLILVTLKSYVLPKVSEQLLTLYGQGIPLLFLANGIPWWYILGKDALIDEQAKKQIDPADLSKKIRPADVIGGVIYSPNTIIEPGVIRCGSMNSRFILGAATSDGEKNASAAQELFLSANINAIHSKDIRTEVWRKLLLNASLAVIATLVMGHNHDVIQDPALHTLTRKILNEIISVAQAHGATISTDEVKLDTSSLAAHYPSMLQDLVEGRPLETESTLGAVQTLAKAANIQTPLFDTAAVLLNARARLRK